MQHAINGVRLHWREAGAGDPVVFIHGFPFNRAMWDGQLAAVPGGWVPTLGVVTLTMPEYPEFPAEFVARTLYR